MARPFLRYVDDGLVCYCLTMARLFLRYVDDGLVLGMSAWPSWALRPKEPHGFRGRKAILNHAQALVSACS